MRLSRIPAEATILVFIGLCLAGSAAVGAAASVLLHAMGGQ